MNFSTSQFQCTKFNKFQLFAYDVRIITKVRFVSFLTFRIFLPTKKKKLPLISSHCTKIISSYIHRKSTSVENYPLTLNLSTLTNVSDPFYHKTFVCIALKFNLLLNNSIFYVWVFKSSKITLYTTHLKPRFPHNTVPFSCRFFFHSYQNRINLFRRYQNLYSQVTPNHTSFQVFNISLLRKYFQSEQSITLLIRNIQSYLIENKLHELYALTTESYFFPIPTFTHVKVLLYIALLH